ncbi:hypothetical protein N0V85_007650 [Neurospora sp. IMI 360204]|nr:hypothetical protein N0V85_007650 [Neurospora sp. IMI 360204]
MKFTTTAALLLATGITAMPWSSSKAKTPSSSVYEEDITLRIEVVPKNQQQQNQNPLFSTKKKSTKHQDFASLLEDGDGDEICWSVCFPEELQCPETWHSKQFGDCWTCCKTLENDSVDL